MPRGGEVGAGEVEAVGPVRRSVVGRVVAGVVGAPVVAGVVGVRVVPSSRRPAGCRPSVGRDARSGRPGHAAARRPDWGPSPAWAWGPAGGRGLGRKALWGAGAMSSPRGGRPVKLTAALALRLVTGLLGGYSRRNAAAELGVGSSTLSRWLRRGRLTGEEPYRQLYAALEAVREARESPEARRAREGRRAREARARRRRESGGF